MDSESGLQPGEVREVQASGLLTFPGGRDLDHAHQGRRPALEMAYAFRSSDNAHTDLAALFSALMGAIEKQAILGMRRSLGESELEFRLAQVRHGEMRLGKLHASTSSGSGRPRVDASFSSSSSSIWSGRAVLTGEVKRTGVASRTKYWSGASGRRR